MSADPWFAGRRPAHRPAHNPAAFLDELTVPEWMSRGLCAQTDPEAFYPEKGGSTAEAKRTCLSCDVRTECLQYALEHGERFGIWGGLSERERRRLTKADDAPPRPCARQGCPETIPVTAHAQKRYHDTECGRLAREDLFIKALNVEQIVAEYQTGNTTVARLAARHKVPAAVITRLLDEHQIPRRRPGGHWTTPRQESA